MTTASRTIRIGITGPIGCGKSRVASWLAELGATVIDADVEARTVTAPGTGAHDEILEHWPSASGADGRLDRKALGEIVFSDPAALAELEGIVHPAVRGRILAAIDAADAAGVPAVAIEAIKLVEGGLAALCDEVWLVICDETEQRGRIVGRGASAEEADQRIEAQAGLVERISPAATRLVDTTGSPDETRARVVEAFGEAVARRS